MNETLELLKEIKRTLKLIEKEKGISMNHSMTIIKGWITEDKKEEWENGRYRGKAKQTSEGAAEAKAIE